MTVSVRELPWWELSEVAAADERIFGATAWTLPYYWAVAAQPGTAMFVARDEGTGDLAGCRPRHRFRRDPDMEINARFAQRVGHLL